MKVKINKKKNWKKYYFGLVIFSTIFRKNSTKKLVKQLNKFELNFGYLENQSENVFTLLSVFELHVSNTDALHLTIPPQGLPNGEPALPHAAYPGIPPYPGVGEYTTHFLQSHFTKKTLLKFKFIN